MPTIEQILDVATPATVQPPRLAEIHATIHRRSTKRKALAWTSAVGLILGVSVLAIGVVGKGQAIETVGDGLSNTTELENMAPSTGVAATIPTSMELVQSTPSEDRWFLVPPPSEKIQHLQDNQLVWSRAQSGDNQIMVTTDSSNPAEAGLAIVYYLEGIGVSIADGPEELSETFQQLEVDGRTARVGSDTAKGSAKAFIEAEGGIFAVVGHGITEEQALDLALAAALVDGRADLGGRVPTGFSIVPEPTAVDTDYSATLQWGAEDPRVTLLAHPGLLETVALDLRHSGPAAPAESILVRGEVAVFVPVYLGQEPAILAWEENGYVFSLSAGSDQDAIQLEELAKIAESLVRTSQPDLIERLGDSFMERQVEGAEAWLASSPLPDGWNPLPLIYGVPQSEVDSASFVYQYLDCAWVAEWATAIETGDVAGRVEAETMLADRPNWPVLAQTFFIKNEGISEKFLTGLDAQMELMRQVRSVSDLDSVAGYGCGFVVPSDR